LAGFSFNDKEYNKSANHHIEGPRVQVINKIIQEHINNKKNNILSFFAFFYI